MAMSASDSAHGTSAAWLLSALDDSADEAAVLRFETQEGLNGLTLAGEGQARGDFSGVGKAMAAVPSARALSLRLRMRRRAQSRSPT